jgi:tetratricopeptide (TPR) repeat protein
MNATIGGKSLVERLRTRRALFRLGAVLVGLAPFVIVESALILLDVGRPSTHDDPFVGFSAVRPLFERNVDGTRYEIPRSRLPHFQPDSFGAVKQPHEYRIFCIGDSTVQGNPWTIETSFGTWLEISLNAAEPDRHWDVVNCGGISYASYRMVPILEEVLRYKPDLLVVHCSHNEFLEDRTYDKIKRTPRVIARTHEVVSQLRTYTLLRSACGQTPKTSQAGRGRTVLSDEVEALLDYRGGLEAYHRDDEWRRAVIAHYEHNLRWMVRIARDAGVPILLMNPVCNLRDSPPFKAEHRVGLTDEERERWESLWSEARRHYGRDNAAAVSLLRDALDIDDQHAGLRFDLAKCYEAMGLLTQARAEFMQAKELDVCPLRILEPMNQIVLDVSRETGTPLVNNRQLFEELSPGGIPGDKWLVDHVHPSIRGYQILGDAVADEMVRLGIIHPAANWKAERENRYVQHMDSLDAAYFSRGQQHLQGLMLWAHGRVTRERVGKAAAVGSGQ